MRCPNLLFCFLQLIQTISAVDTDEPLVGHKFVFSISPTNPNFTIDDREGKIFFSFFSFFNLRNIHEYILTYMIQNQKPCAITGFFSDVVICVLFLEEL